VGQEDPLAVDVLEDRLSDLELGGLGLPSRAENRLNQRPRKTLGFKTPADKLNEMLR
jgi:hypothetical protein